MKRSSAAQKKRDRLTPAVAAIKDARISIDALLIVDQICRRCRAAGTDGVMVTRGELAYSIGVTPDEAEALLDQAIQAGHVFVSKAFGRPPIYKPNLL